MRLFNAEPDCSLLPEGARAHAWVPRTPRSAKLAGASVPHPRCAAEVTVDRRSFELIEARSAEPAAETEVRRVQMARFLRSGDEEMPTTRSMTAHDRLLGSNLDPSGGVQPCGIHDNSVGVRARKGWEQG